jgi:hypothetical protein
MHQCSCLSSRLLPLLYSKQSRYVSLNDPDMCGAGDWVGQPQCLRLMSSEALRPVLLQTIARVTAAWAGAALQHLNSN